MRIHFGETGFQVIEHAVEGLFSPSRLDHFLAGFVGMDHRRLGPGAIDIHQLRRTPMGMHVDGHRPVSVDYC